MMARYTADVLLVTMVLYAMVLVDKCSCDPSTISFSQLTVLVDETPFVTGPKPTRYIPLRTPSLCFAQFIAPMGFDPQSIAPLLTVDAMFFTILLTVIVSNDTTVSSSSYTNATNITEAMYSRFVDSAAGESRGELFMCLSDSNRYHNFSLYNMTRGASAPVRVPSLFMQQESFVYESLMKAIVGVSLAFIVLQLYLFAKFRSSSLYQRLESHKRGGGANRTWKQKILATLFP